jgi:FkbM family methyltransferase
MKKYIQTLKYLMRQIRYSIILLTFQKYRYLGNSSTIKIQNKKIRIIDGTNYYMQYKDIFFHRIYQFQTDNTHPLIIDGGSNIGMSVLFFKLKYPDSKIIGFEPDSDVFRVLLENIQNLSKDDITLINAGLGKVEGEASFSPDGNVGGYIVNKPENSTKVKLVKLSNYINSKVDYLKLNIEGLEYEVLEEVENAGKLENIAQIALEYHGWKNSPQLLGKILDLLERNNFRYLIHDFDSETCSTSKPPINFSKHDNWFCIVYAMNQKYLNI